MKIAKITKEGIAASYANLQDKSTCDISYVVLTASAAAICSFGFKMNSPSVIVGAMVISPSLFSVVAISAVLFLRKWKTFAKNLWSLVFGIVIAISISFIINTIFPAPIVGSEILGRIVGNRLDYFFVAFFSGLAGSFAFFWPDIIEAIAGIAISVALIPPVVMVGIGLANGETSLMYVSIIIVLINIIGILLGSFLTIVGLNVYAKITQG